MMSLLFPKSKNNFFQGIHVEQQTKPNSSSGLSLILTKSKELGLICVTVTLFYATIFSFLTIFETQFLTLFTPSPGEGIIQILNRVIDERYILFSIWNRIISGTFGFGSVVYLISLYVYLSEFRKVLRDENGGYRLALEDYFALYLLSAIIVIAITIFAPLISQFAGFSSTIYPEFKSVFYLLPFVWLMIAFIYSEEERIIPWKSMRKDVRGFLELGVWFVSFTVLLTGLILLFLFLRGFI